MKFIKCQHCRNDKEEIYFSPKKKSPGRVQTCIDCTEYKKNGVKKTGRLIETTSAEFVK